MRKILFFSLMLLLTIGCVSARKYEMKVSEADQLQQQVEDLNAEIEKLNKEKSDLEENNKNLNEALNATKSEKDKMISDLTKKKQDLEAKARELELEKEKAIKSLKGTYENLVEDLKGEIKKGEIQITQLEGMLTVNMVDKIIFDSGFAEVNKQGKNTLQKVGSILKKTADKQILIEGHTDNIPVGQKLKDKYPTNWELSTSRATNVARFLIEEAGVDEKMISVAGYADKRPVASNKTSAGRAKNRRIEIKLVPVKSKK